MRISVIEYGLGNVQSVVNACVRLGHIPNIAESGESLANKSQIERSSRRGAVGTALKALMERGFKPHWIMVLNSNIPFLGICVGMQVLAEKCYEQGSYDGFGWIPGIVDRLAPISSDVKLPHVGWNTLKLKKNDDPVIGCFDGEDVYFVHSQVFSCEKKYVVSETYYYKNFVSAIRNKHILGVQFHPEKSLKLGQELIGSFVEGGNA